MKTLLPKLDIIIARLQGEVDRLKKLPDPIVDITKRINDLKRIQANLKSSKPIFDPNDWAVLVKENIVTEV